MADNKTYYAEERTLDFWLCQNANFGVTSPAAVYVALFTADPGNAGSQASEVSSVGTAYARVAATGLFGAPAGTPRQTTNSGGAVTFPTATASWGTVTHMAILDAATAGNMLYYGPLTASKTVDPGDTVTFPVSSITAQEQ